MSGLANIQHSFNTINGNTYRLNLRQLTAQAFGMSGISLYQLPKEGLSEKNEKITIKTYDTTERMATGLLGLPVYSTLLFVHKGVELLLLEPIIELTAEKNIVKTAIQGRHGTIKEFVSDGDIVISVKCIINDSKEVDETRRRYLPPYQALSKYYEMLKLPEAIEVECELLQIFGINNVVVTNYSISESGMANIKNCTINMISDIAPEIQITKNV